MKNPSHQRRRISNWTVPLSYAIAALALGMTFPRLEHGFLPGLVSTMSPEAAMSFCSAIASGMIALTGIVFSLTFVMVQFSATAYSPRLVLWLARDPVMAHALGVFSATFLYALALLAWVDRGDSGRVPLISAWLVLALLLASVALFIALIERIGLLQINRMLIFTGDRGRAAIADLYPSLQSLPAITSPEVLEGRPVTQVVTHLGRPRVIQAIDIAALVSLAADADAIIEVPAAVGDTVIELTPLVRVYHTQRTLDERHLREAIVLGDERTFEQDPKYAIRLVVDIAIKALSPAINDPTTAVQALDQVEDLLLRLGRRRLEIGNVRDAQGRLRLRMSFPTWDDLVRLALDEILAYGADSVQVMRRINALISNLLASLPPERHLALRHWTHRVRESIANHFAQVEDQREASVADRQGLGIGNTAPAGSQP